MMGKGIKIDQIQSRAVIQRFSLCPVVKQVDVFNVGRSDNRTSGFTDIRLSGGNLLKDETLEDCSALNLVDFYPLPHHGNFPFKKAVEATICLYDSKLDLRPINNKQVITVMGDTVTVG